MHVITHGYGPNCGAAAPLSMQRSYDRYYSTGLYASRYPTPNPHMLKLILGELGPAGGRVLDFGCGTGRYALPLAQQPGVQVFGYDISPAAIQEMNRSATELSDARGEPLPLDMLCGSFDELEKRLDREDGFDAVMLLFGVLGHIPQHQRRVEMLRALRARLRPGGRLIATVPNRVRRFHAEQKAAEALVAEGRLEPGDIQYQRRGLGDPIELFYHLYSPAEFRDELADAGFLVRRLQTESVLTERAVLTSPLCNAADHLLRRVTPVSLAYGFVAIGETMTNPAG